MRLIRRLVGVAVLLAGKATPAALAPAPAHAATCTAQSVMVVVDFGALGGATQQACVGGGGKASALFEAAGHRFTWVSDQAGAVCRIDSKPASDPCSHMPAATSYWALFWTDGTSSHWSYASLGVDSLNVPAGGSVGFAWQSTTGTRAPGVTPAVTKTATPKKTQTAKATPQPSAKSTPKPAPKTSAPTRALAVTPSASVPSSPATSRRASASATPGKHAAHKPKGTVSTAATTARATASALPTASTRGTSITTATEPTSSTHSGGLPGWVAPGVVGVVLAAGGGVALARRRLRG